MRLNIECVGTRVIPLPWRGRLYIMRCDSDRVYLRVLRPGQSRPTYHRLADYHVFDVPESLQDVAVEIENGDGGVLEMEFVQIGTPTPISASPRGGRVRSGELTIQPGQHVRLPSYRVVEGRDVVLTAPESNTAPVYVEQFPIAPGYTLQIQPAVLSDLDIWVSEDAGAVQTLVWLAEVRA